MNFHEVYEHFRNIFLFLNHIDFSFDKFFFMNFHEVYIFESFFFFRHIDFPFLIAWRSVHPLKFQEFFVHVRNESTIWTVQIV